MEYFRSLAAPWFGKHRADGTPEVSRPLEHYLPLDTMKQEPPPGWKLMVHPDGTIYFFQRKSQRCKVNIVTPDDVMKETIRENLQQNIAFLLNDSSMYLPPKHDCELWIKLTERDPEEFDHVFLDHTDRTAFCLPASGDVLKKRENSYWECFSRAPVHHHLPAMAEDEMMLALSHFTGERIMENEKTISPFTLTQCEQLVSLYKTLMNELPRHSGVRRWFVSVVMLEICHARIKTNCNESPALTVSGTETPSGRKHTMLDWCLMILCFSMHERYRRRLLHARANGGIQVSTFQKLLAGALQEWTDSNLLSTVFVSANMAFLAVPSIQKTQQTLVIVSTFFSVASVMVGVHHLWTHRPKAEVDADETVVYMHRAAGTISSITFTSIFLCLPLVFLLWAVLFFSIALLHFAFRAYSGDSRIILACVAGLVILVTFCVLVFFYWIWDDA